ncbi:protease Do-like 7 [Iris pallida]|uniref:Protease Do-like 7 n=1 Tax=Iris pallida TaxID=29817 RepID=A0AAX6I4D5_IRIPA|nr:protease Do-like 7 [Iris pallida]
MTCYWNTRPAIPSGSSLFASSFHFDNIKARFTTMSEDKSSPLKLKHPCNNKDLDEECIKMETIGESNVEVSNSGEDSNFKIKR